MTQQILYKECPVCTASAVTGDGKTFRCDACGLVVAEKSFLGLFNKGKYGVVDWGEHSYSLATQSLEKTALSADDLRVALGNAYSDDHLATIAAGDVEILRPVRTVLAEIILEQLGESCYIQVVGMQRGFGPPLEGPSSYKPTEAAPTNLDWQDKGNLFCTERRIVFPSNQFTFIRLGRKVIGVKAFTNAVAVQLKREDHAIYFVGCYAHEAAIVAAYTMARVPKLYPNTQEA